jgi:aryl-alcohol dehydrogenase
VKATAAILRERAQPFSLEEVELQPPGFGEVLVKIAASGMCHTDSLPRIEAFPVSTPVVLGHEGAGVIEAVGPGVTGLDVGAHVVLSYDSCGVCVACLEARPGHCSTFFARNLTGRRTDGSTSITDADDRDIPARWFAQSSFATHSIATMRNTVVVDDSLPLGVLAPLGCGVQTGAGTVLLGLGVTYGSSVAIFGVGAVGLSAIMAARVAGATRIIAVDRYSSRLQLALELGASDAIDATDADLPADVLAVRGPVDFAIDTTGNPSVITHVVSSTAQGGTCALIAGPTGPVTFPPDAFSGRRIIGIIEGEAVPQRFIPQLIDLWQDGRFPFDRLIQEFDFADINKAEKESARGDVVKPVLRMPP